MYLKCIKTLNAKISLKIELPLSLYCRQSILTFWPPVRSLAYQLPRMIEL